MVAWDLDEGYIKFQVHWENSVIDPALVPHDLMAARDRLHNLGLVGVYLENGIGFGNVSCRLPGGEICISGSATGAFFPSLPKHFAIVDRIDLSTNQVWCKGEFPASSETMTHGSIYAQNDAIKCVLHIHSPYLWQKLLWQIPTTAKEVPYGTVAMAEEVKRLFEVENIENGGMIAMAGHEEGLIAFGVSAHSALDVILGKMVK